MGACVTSGLDSATSRTMEEEEIVMRSEDDEFFLARVYFDDYWDKIKLVGYQMDLKPDHMEQIKDDINLDTELLSLTSGRNVTKEVLCDEDFGFNNGKHDPFRLLLIGFMYCRMRD